MIIVFVYTLPLGLIVYFLLRKKSASLRLGVSLAIWLLPPLVLIIYVLIVGDQMPPIPPAPGPDR